MTHDQIKELAREAGLSFIPEANCPLVRIVQKAVELEREECAQLMEEQDTQAPKHNAKAIRARSQA